MIQKTTNFFKEIKAELNKVEWPTKERTRELTFLVIFITLAIALFTGILDFAFRYTIDLLI